MHLPQRPMHTIEIIKPEPPYYQEILCFYKVNPCLSCHKKNNRDLLPIVRDNDQALCFQYHSPSERRRNVFSEDGTSILYRPVKCPYSPCHNGEECEFSHNMTEINFHPLYYKTEPCPGCAYENNVKFCPYFHSDENSRKFILEKLISRMAKDNMFRNQQNTEVDDNSSSGRDNFKVKPCTVKGNHNPKVCEYYHHASDRRRSTDIFSYSANMCPNVNNKNAVCPNGDDCELCHNKVEQLYHPQRYKKKFCTEHPHNLQKCEYGNYCSFAHSEEEIQIELLHNMKKDDEFYLYKYKTVFCPYIYGHDRNQCFYAHNPQDYRRDPSKFTYSAVQCPNWLRKQIFSYEEGGCADQMQCRKCHGWKEQEYHPMSYKTEPCRNAKNCVKKDCSYYHNNNEQRRAANLTNDQMYQNLIGPTTQNSMMQIFPFPGKENAYVPNRSGQSLDLSVPLNKMAKKKGNYNSGPIAAVSEIISQNAYEAKARQRAMETPVRVKNASMNFPMENYSQSQQVKKKKKSKKMSMQNRTDNKQASPLGMRYEKSKGMHVKNEVFKNEVFGQNMFPQEQEEKKVFEDFKSFGTKNSTDEDEINKSMDSLHSWEENLAPASTSKFSEAMNNRFIRTLFSNLEKKGFEHAVHHFKSQNVDIESLKSFSAKDFQVYPQIPQADREKIVKIIQDTLITLEGEDILYEVDAIQEKSQDVDDSEVMNETDDRACSFMLSREHVLNIFP